MPKSFQTILVTALLVAGSVATTALATDPAAASDGSKLAAGLSPVTQLLQLMDTDKNGKVSKEEFMRFMEQEFNYADKNKDDELDPKELSALVRNINRPLSGPGR